MYSQTRRNALLTLGLMLAFVLACSAFSDETDKANKLVGEGNTAVTDGDKLVTDGSSKSEKVFNDLTADNFEADKENLAGAAKESVDLMTKGADKYREASKKFDEASKLKIGDKFKEYLTFKSQAFSKRAEQVDAAKKDPQAVLDSNNFESLLAKVQANKSQLEKLDKEAKDLNAKADKIQAENKDKIK